MTSNQLPLRLTTESEATSSNFDQLVKEVHECRNCIRMSSSRRVLSRSAGPLTAPLMFIGEAPGRLGADGSEIPFHGDKAGHNFEDLVQQVGLDRYNIFITNAVLCNPKDKKGNNSPPNQTEIHNCSNFLRRQIDIVNPTIVVTLGGTALNALTKIAPHHLSLREHVRTSHSWYGRLLIPAYHPGQRAMIHRSFANQLSDYQYVQEQFVRLSKKRAPVNGIIEGKVLSIVDMITRLRGTTSYFSLHKLFYLAEINHFRRSGQRITNAYIIRQKDGPYCTALHLYRLKKAFSDLRVRKDGNKLFIERQVDGIELPLFQKGTSLSSEESISIAETVEKYGQLSDDRLKTVVYLTSPMKKILKEEKHRKVNLFNAPIYFA